MTASMLVAYALTGVIGVSLGALGSGGAILMLPLLVYVAKVPAAQAVPLSMAVVAFSSFAGASQYFRRGDFSPRLMLVFGVGGMSGAFAGAQFTHFVSEPVLMSMMSALLVTVGTMMLRGRHFTTCANPCLPPRCALIAFGIGLLTGFLGVGGGFLLVPALMRFAGLDQRSAAGTSLGLISLNAMSGLAGQLRHTQIDWLAATFFLIACLWGLAGGVYLSTRLPEDRLRRAFAWLLVTIGVSVGTATAVRALVN